MKRVLLFPLVVLFLGAGPALSQNLLQNPNFDTDTANWSAYSGEFTFSQDGTAGHLAPGAARVDVNTTSGSLNALVFKQCVAVTPNTSYDISLWFFYPSSVANTPFGHVQMQWASDANCAVSLLNDTTTPGINGTADTWTHITGTVVSRPGANSAAFTIAVGTSGTGQSQAFYDELQFGLSGSLPVTLQRLAAE